MSDRRRRVHGDAVAAPPEPLDVGSDAEEPTPGHAGRSPGSRRRQRRILESPIPDRVSFEPDDAPKLRGARPPVRLSALWSLVKLAFGVAMVVGLALSVAWGAHRYAVTTARFAIRQIDVEGADRLKADEVARLSGAELGQNLLSFEPEKAEQKLLTTPWVREASVGRELPSTLAIRIKEHEAVALLALSDELYLLTQEGVAFKELADSDPYDLPVVTGLAADELARDRTAAEDRVRAGLEVLRRYEELAMSRVHPAEELHLTPAGELVLSVGRTGVSLHLGTGQWPKKLEMAERVLSELAARGETPGMIFLDNSAHPERVVVRLR